MVVALVVVLRLGQLPLWRVPNLRHPLPYLLLVRKIGTSVNSRVVLDRPELPNLHPLGASLILGGGAQ